MSYLENPKDQIFSSLLFSLRSSLPQFHFEDRRIGNKGDREEILRNGKIGNSH